MSRSPIALLALLATTAAHAQPRKAPAAAPSAEQRAAFKKHMTAAYALEKQKKWAQVVPELEAALAVIDSDARALAELGYAAMNAGDFAKAKRADEQAVQIAIDKPVKAAALYNLGLVAQRSGDAAGALRAFRASLELRPNKTVEQAVASLGAEATKPPPPFCAAGQKACDCVLADAFDDTDGRTCTLDPKPAIVPGFHVYHVERPWHSEHRDYLLDDRDQLVAIIGGGFEYRFGRVMNDLTLDKAEVLTIGGHKVLRIQTTDDTMETSGEDEANLQIIVTKLTTVTLCVLDKAATRCPLRNVPIAATNEPSNGKHTETVLDLTIAATGVATIKLVKGASDAQIDALVGPHPLW